MFEALAIIALFVLFSRSGKSSPLGPHKRDGGSAWGDREWTKGTEADSFPWDTNSIYIDPECRFVFEGRHFFPVDWATQDTFAEEAPSVPATLAIHDENTVMGYIDHLVDNEGITDPLIITRRIFAETSPMCAAVPEDQWSEGLRAWYTSLAGRVSDYVTQETIG